MPSSDTSRHFDFHLALGIPLALMAALLLFDPSGLDFALARPFYEPGQGFAGRYSFWLEDILHDRAKQAVILLGMAAVAGFLLSLLTARLRPWRRQLGYLVLALAVGQGGSMVFGPQVGKRAEDLREGVRLRSAAVAPIVGMRGVYGVLALGRSNGSAPFTREDLRLLNVLTGHSAPYVESILSSRRMQGIGAEVITSYAQAVEAKDIYTRGHSERVGGYAVLLGRALGLSGRDLAVLRSAGILHDIGKIGIPDHILNKPSSLSHEEFEIMKRHPVTGRDILSRVSSLHDVVPLVYHHHEWFNGQGYPTGASGEGIPLMARILSVVDGFEALTSLRSYHAPMTVPQVKQALLEGAGRQWDPAVVSAWVGLLGDDALPDISEAVSQALSFQ